MVLRLVLLAAVFALAGCSGSGEDSPAPAPSSAPPWQVVEGALGRCGPQPAAVTDTRIDYRVLRDPEVGAIPSVRVGDGPVVAVLLHQTDGNGLCGWLPFAAEVERAGMTALAIDLCGYGKSACDEAADQVDPVAAAVRYARDELDARRVVVVGASMGGSVALIAGATVPGIDAVADLSGPVEWEGMSVVRGGGAVRVPALVAMADTEGPDEVAAATAIAEAAPTGSRFAGAASGHGYELLAELDGTPLPFADEVLAWIAGTP